MPSGITEAMITAAMAKVETRVCVGSDRCDAFPDSLEDAQASCTATGWYKVGGIMGPAVVRAGTCGSG